MKSRHFKILRKQNVTDGQSENSTPTTNILCGSIYDFLVNAKAAPHEFVIRTGQT